MFIFKFAVILKISVISFKTLKIHLLDWIYYDNYYISL